MPLTLRYTTPAPWAGQVVDNLDRFLPDHASAEYKASGMAMSMSLHYRDKPDLVNAMVDLAIEELAHFREVVKILHQRGLMLQKDEKDPYVNALRGHLRRGPEHYLLDRLLTGAIIEARGAERFGLVAEALPAGALKEFYTRITRSEDRHYELFLELAGSYCDPGETAARLDQLLDIEAQLVERLPWRAALH